MVLGSVFHQKLHWRYSEFRNGSRMLHEEGIAVGTVIIDDDVAVKIACIQPDVAVLRVQFLLKNCRCGCTSGI